MRMRSDKVISCPIASARQAGSVRRTFRINLPVLIGTKFANRPLADVRDRLKMLRPWPFA